MAYNYFRTIYIENTFSAGLAVGSLRSFLAGQNAGNVNVGRAEGDHVEIEICTYNSMVMSYAEEKLAPFV